MLLNWLKCTNVSSNVLIFGRKDNVVVYFAPFLFDFFCYMLLHFSWIMLQSCVETSETQILFPHVFDFLRLCNKILIIIAHYFDIFFAPFYISCNKWCALWCPPEGVRKGLKRVSLVRNARESDTFGKKKGLLRNGTTLVVYLWSKMDYFFLP